MATVCNRHTINNHMMMMIMMMQGPQCNYPTSVLVLKVTVLVASML